MMKKLISCCPFFSGSIVVFKCSHIHHSIHSVIVFLVLELEPLLNQGHSLAVGLAESFWMMSIVLGQRKLFSSVPLSPWGETTVIMMKMWVLFVVLVSLFSEIISSAANIFSII